MEKKKALKIFSAIAGVIAAVAATFSIVKKRKAEKA